MRRSSLYFSSVTGHCCWGRNECISCLERSRWHYFRVAFCPSAAILADVDYHLSWEEFNHHFPPSRELFVPISPKWKQMTLLALWRQGCRVFSDSPLTISCEQSLSFFRFSEGSARASVERWSGEKTRETTRAWSFSRLSRFARRTKIEERLLVVYFDDS